MALLTRREFLKLLGHMPVMVPAGLGLPTILAEASSGYSLIRFAVNGRPVEYRHESGRTVSLLDFVRTQLGLRGTKYGCGRGVCGACSVLVEGRPVRSCVANAEHLSGLNVSTIEHLGGTGSIDPILKTFADLSVFQCGYCAPGFAMVTRALLNKTPHPSREEVREALYGNLCRCTGYLNIIDAVLAVNDQDLCAFLLKASHSGVAGYNGDRLALEKVTGQLVYARDFQMSDQLFARVVWSSHPHALIDAIDTAEAGGTPGVVRVLTHKDIPGRKTFGSIIPDQPVLAFEKVRFLGDALAVVVAENPDAARLGAERVRVAYRPLPGVFSPEDALAPDAPSLTEKGNICGVFLCSKGSVEKAGTKARAVVKHTYRTGFVEHAYLEVESCLTYVDEEGFLVVVSASQAPHSYRDQIAAICGLPKDRVQMQTTVAGGAFGAKGDMSIQHLCALGTLVTGRPVRLDLTREESIRVHVKRHPFTLTYETGADEQGKLLFCRVEGLADVGAYHSASIAVLDNAAAFATGPYEIDHIEVKITGAFTNNPTCGAMRGFGVPQVCLAMERQVDELAARLRLDPLEMRQRNILDAGKISQWGQVMEQGVGIGACLTALREATQGARTKVKLEQDEKVGLGFAAAYKNTSSPTHIPLSRAEVTLALNRHGRVVASVAGSELGQGLVTAMAQITAHGLGIPIDLVEVVFGSTRAISSPLLTSASQQIFLTGAALLEACPRFDRLLLETAAELWGLQVAELSLGPGGFINRVIGEQFATYYELAWRSRIAGRELSVTHAYVPPVTTIDPPERVIRTGPEQKILPSLGYCAQAALVAVNASTGAVRIVKIFAAQDVGRVINRAGVSGQIQGGVVMGLGWTLKERLELDKGKIVNDNLDRYLIPRTRDVPEIEELVIEVPDPLGPLGAKGIGELPILPTAPAILNAIYDAVGLSLCDLPVSAAGIRQQLSRSEP
jgi:aldehyde oxidoreductase